MKKLRLILSMVCLLAFGMIVNQAQAQQTRGGTPPTFLVKEAQALPAQAYVKMPVNFSISELLKQDAFEKQHNDLALPHYAKIIHTDITMDNSGVWTEFPDGTKVWRVAVEAKGAKALMLYYDDFYLPAGSSLFIYNADKTHVLGAYDNASNPHGSYYSTVFVAGDISVLEYVAPAQETGDKPKITVTKVGYGYNNIKIVPVPFAETPEYLFPNASINCQINVVCSPEGDDWQKQSSSVCNMTLEIGGGYVSGCSGTLINNTRNDLTPYIISAFHCADGMTEAQLAQSQFHFFFEELNCDDRWDAGSGSYLPNPNTVANHYPWMKTIIGAKLVASINMSGGSDGLLLKLNQNIPLEWIQNGEIIFAGWDRRDTPATTAQSGVCISHPSGDVKKIATYTSPASIHVGSVNWQNYGAGAANACWDATFVRTTNGMGQTEGGSSGSGLLNQDGLLIGTCSGGGAISCTQNSVTTYFGGLFYHWDKYGTTPSTQFKTWLDPVGNGTAETCPPYEDVISDFTCSQTSIYVLQSTTFKAIVPSNIDSILWEFEDGTPATSTEAEPVIAYNTAGTFDVTLNVYTKSKSTGNDTVIIVKKEDYITATIKPGSDASAPVADFAVYERLYGTPSFSQDGTGTVATGTSGTHVFVKATASGTISNSYLTNYTWMRVLNDYSIWANPSYPIGLLGNGYGSTGGTANSDYYYYCFLPVLGSANSVRMYNRQAINLSTYQKAVLRLKFKIGANPLTSTSIETFAIQYRTATSGAGSTWTTIFTRPASEGSTISAPTTGTDGWIDIEVDLPNINSTTYYIGFVSSGSSGTTYGRGMGIDNIEIINYSDNKATHVTLWEGDVAEYTDLSTGVPVVYEYNFEGGTPDVSTSDAPKIPVQYNTAGLYDASQFVKNTQGEDTKLLDDYVTVIGRVLETDIDTFISGCNEAISQDIIITANRSWKLTTPSWLNISPTLGTITTPGTDETFTIQLTAPANTSYLSNVGEIIITTDDNKAQTKVYVAQTSIGPTNLKAERYDSVNAKITWERPAGMPAPLSQCDISIAGCGGFETDPYAAGWKTFIEGESNADGKGWEFYQQVDSYILPHRGNYFALSQSWDGLSSSATGYDLNADNWLVTPKLHVTDEYHILKYWIQGYDDTYYEEYAVYLSTASDITNVSNFNVQIRPLQQILFNGPDYENNWYFEREEDLTAYIGQDVYIAFRHKTNGGYFLFIDDVSGIELADCSGTTSAVAPNTSAFKKNVGHDMLRLKNEINNPVYALAEDGNLIKSGRPNKAELKQRIEALQSNNSSEALQPTNASTTSLFKASLNTANIHVKPEAAVGIDPPLMQWCTDYIRAIGAGGAGFTVAARWTPDELTDYAGKTIKAVDIACSDPADIADLFVWEIDGTDTVVLSSQRVSKSTLVELSTNLIPLKTPVTISGDKEIIIGYTIETYGSTEYPFGSDDGPLVAGKGNLVYLDGEWYELTDLGDLPYNWYIVGYENYIADGFKLYRQRTVNGVSSAPEVVAEGLSDAIINLYDDKNIQPGGYYCYWVTYVSNGVESCSSDTSCVFILYQQEIQAIDDIEMTYGDPKFFKIDKAGTDDVELVSTINAIDYFAGRTIPVKLEITSGNSILLTGVESDYTAELERAGVTTLLATQEGIEDTLLAAEPVEFTITIKKGDLYVKVEPKVYTREEGQQNPSSFILDYIGFVYGDNVSTLDVAPTATCAATPLSPAGEYAIVVNVGLDKRYNVIPENGILKVTKSTVVPNVFTPNSDGINDAFMTGNRMKIFNRYGVLIYETKNKAEIDRGWNGRFQDNDQLVNPGVYYYVLYDENGKAIRKGSVNVVKK